MWWHRTNKLGNALALSAVVFAGGTQAFAVPNPGEQSGDLPCAILEDYAGSLNIMDSSRTHLIESKKKAAIPCGGWISTGAGRAKVSHRDGYEFIVAANTFVQVTENNTDGKHSGDSMVLFKGEVWAKAPAGHPDFRIVTPNARVRIQKGSGIVLFSHAEEDTQLVALDGQQAIENRFSPSASVVTKAGEASHLNLRQMRTVPTAPRAVSVASLKAKLGAFQLGEKEHDFAVRVAQARADRTFPSELPKTAPTTLASDLQNFTPEPARSVASVELGAHGHSVPAPGKGKTVRRTVDVKNSGQRNPIQEHMTRRLAGGESIGEKILFPENPNGRSRKVSLEIEDVGHRARQQAADREKKKLLDELSQIQVD